MRKNYIDNLRITCILLLFPYHTCRIFTEENFYVHVKEVMGCELFVQLMNPWFMPLLFLLAGMSTYLSLAKRGKIQYIKERISKLLVPYICGVLLIVPIQTFYAEKYHNHYTGTYLQQLKLFFTKETDMTGYTGGFTPAHLWFLLVLFIISIILLPIILKIRKVEEKQFKILENPIILFLLFVPLMITGMVGVAGMPIVKHAALMLIGTLLCADEHILRTVRKYRGVYLGIMLLTAAQYVLTEFGIHGEAWSWFEGVNKNIRMWSTILAIIGYAMEYYNKSSKVTNYFRLACFPIYEVHQTILVGVGYYIVSLTSSFWGEYLGIVILSFILSIGAYELLRCFKVTRWMFGIKERTVECEKGVRTV